MSASVPSRPAVPTSSPRRGTQSFVAVMSGVWRRPGLTAIEVLWRWAAGAPLLFLALRAVAHALHAHPLDTRALDAMTVFQPLAAATTLQQQLAPYPSLLFPTARWLVPLGLLVWVLSSTLGRMAIWRRLDPALPVRTGPAMLFGLLRLLLLLTTLLVWLAGLAAAGRYSMSRALAAGGEPNLVLLTALAVLLTLLLLLLWSVAVWVLDAAPLFAFTDAAGVAGSVRAAFRARDLRSELVEITLVMSIVKVGLTVLAVVFMATPLPFAAEETRSFLFSWWTLIFLLYLAALDFFHVVRRAANLSFFRTLMRPVADVAGTRERAY